MKHHVYPVKEIVQISGISARTLRQYEKCGLLSPSSHEPSGAALYDEADIIRLQKILIGRGLGLRLKQIRSVLDRRHSYRGKKTSESARL
jgi:MerR family transcriptional regulator, thiopeptide resistance regulator